MDGIATVLCLDRGIVVQVGGLSGWLFIRSSGSVEIRRDSFKGYLLDPHRSGEFHVLPNALDLLSLRILSHSPPSNPAKTFSQDHLLAVLHTAMSRSSDFTTSDTSPTITFDDDTVQNVTTGPQRKLFAVKGDGSIHLAHRSLATFLSDTRRSGKFHKANAETCSDPLDTFVPH